MMSQTEATYKFQMKSRETLLIRFCNYLFYRVGNWVGTNSVLTVLVCVFISIFFSVKMAITPQVSTMDGYASESARSRQEYQAFMNFLDSDGQGITLGLLIQAKDNGSLLRPDYLNATVEVLNQISEKFPMFDAEKNASQSFSKFCSEFCMVNEPIRAYFFGQEFLDNNDTALIDTDTETLDSRVKLQYPTSEMFGRRFSLLPNFFGVQLSNESNSQTLEAARLIVMVFRAEKHRGWKPEQVKEWELNVGKYFFEKFHSDLITILPYSQYIVEKEIVGAGMSLTPFLLVGFIVMCIFCTTTTFFSGCLIYGHQISMNKVILSIAACVNPFMACGTSMGMMFFFGARYSPLLCITPFLVLAISVDDSFLMLHAWNRIDKECQKSGVLKDTPTKLAEVLVQTGPAITISAMTNILAFIVGAVTSPPDIAIFSVGNALAILVDCVFQATFYTGMMTLCSGDASSVDRKAGKLVHVLRSRLKSFLSFYVKMLENFMVSCTIVMVWIVYIIIAIYGIRQMFVDLSSQKIFLYDSPMIQVEKLRSEMVLPFFYPATILIRNPGDLSNETRLHRLIDMKKQLEQLPASIGSQSTMFFPDEYLKFVAETDLDSADAEAAEEEKSIDSFLEYPEYAHWKGFIKLNATLEPYTSNLSNVKEFMFTTGFHGQELRDWMSRGTLLKQWREVIDRYREFNPSVFTEDGFYLDLLDGIPTIAWQSTIATLLCMVLVCFAFIYHPLIVFVVSVNIFTICLGVFGYLSLLGIALDPMLMSVSIMCIGFSVDLPAHVSFHFFTSVSQHSSARTKASSSSSLSRSSNSETPPSGMANLSIERPNSKDSMNNLSIISVFCDEKAVGREPERLSPQENSEFSHALHHTLSSVGFPVLQAGISTDLCALPLAFVNLYMANLFALAMTVCVTLSMIHGLVVIPALLSITYQVSDWTRRRKDVSPNV